MYMPGYYSMRALNRFLGNVDIRIGYNHYFYHEPNQDQWHVMPWDLDMMYIAETHQAGVIRQQNSILNNPQLMIEFRNRSREILDLVGEDGSSTGGQIGQLVDEYTQMINPRGQTLTWADLDAYLWNYHPRTRGSAGNASGQSNHKGNFYASPYRDSRIGGSYTRYLTSKDHEGLVDHIMSYTTDNFTGGSWSPGNGIVAGYGYEYLKYEARDTNIPKKPIITYMGPENYPIDELSFTSSSFSDPNGSNSFGKMRWRIAKILAPGLPGYIENTPRTYEIETVASSPDFETFVADYIFEAEIAEPGVTYRVRVQHEDDTGRKSHWSDPIEFITGIPDVALWRDNLVISEIMYNPPEPMGSEVGIASNKNDFEYIEITNISENLNIDLSHLDFVNGVQFDFSTASSRIIPPAKSVVLVSNLSAFRARYGDTPTVIGIYESLLSNSGETIRLAYALNTTIIELKYDDNDPWPNSPDGDGYSLVLAEPMSSPNHSLASNWTTSNLMGGSPGSPEPDLLAFGDYIANFFSSEEMADIEISGPFSDPDNDGYSNILEYALLGDPSKNDSLITYATVEENGIFYPSITFSKRIPSIDLTYTPQRSVDLSEWRNGHLHFIEHSSADQGDGIFKVTVRSLVPLSESATQFLRVKVGHPNP
jgi:hypothetical protein